MANSAQTDAVSTGSLFSYDSVALSDPSTHIRLLDLHPASCYTDDLYCCIYTAPISPSPSYIALSYVWGDSTRTHEISVANEVNDGRAFIPLRLTSSLDTCLRHLRELHYRRQLQPLPLWIDQICINQDDNEEKSFQVQLMRDIYSSAHQVVVWLGPAVDDSNRVMDALAEVGQEFVDKIGDHTAEGHWLSVDRLVKEKIDQPDAVAFMRKAYKVIYMLNKENSFTRWVERTWFKRLWTIQEFCLCADTIFACGYKVVSQKMVSALTDFMRCIIMDKCLRGLLETPDTPTYSTLFSGLMRLFPLFQHRGYCQYPYRKETLEHLLVELFVGVTPPCVTNKRDKVYGLLGLAGDADELGIRPDYTTSTTLAQVFTQTARAIIQKNWKIQRKRGLQILRYGSLGQRKSAPKNETDLPSWVPEWNGKIAKTYQREMSFLACGEIRTPDLVPTSSTSILGLRGFCVGTIVDLGEQARVDIWRRAADGAKKVVGFFDNVRRLLDLSKQNKRAKNIYASTAHHDAALWRVPIGDQHIIFGVGRQIAKRTDSNEDSAFQNFIAYYEDYVRRDDDWKEYMAAYQAGEEHAKLKMGKHMDRVFSEGYYMGLRHMEGKRPYLTENGYLGMGPGLLQPGDKVVVFHGDDIPYVVRPVPEKGDNTYLLMGEAYCDGIMDGELADTAEREDLYLV
ncbi:heterokaryon incompatibility protein domain-containing protein [Neurospora intermedia]|uniref:Heterokaryon incompatibility protein domain-containing protein n=1 Tax=Neurospora intermedia TaxID=5142 RepID=A0ABR3DCY9_NEUIN